MRVLLTSDIHDCQFDWYGIPTKERLCLWADSINREHGKSPLDMILLLGDYSLDFWCAGGSYNDRNVSMTDHFVKTYLPLLPENVPVHMIPGNHEQYTRENWQKITGSDRNDVAFSGDCMFILHDSFSGNPEPGKSSDGTYLPMNLNYLQYLMCGFDHKNVFICTHWFDPSLEDSETVKYIKNQPRIKCIFEGHSHAASPVFVDELLGEKPIIQTGNFSYTHRGREEDMFWGYRILESSGDGFFSKYIMPACRADKCYEAVINAAPNPAPAEHIRSFESRESYFIEF